MNDELRAIRLTCVVRLPLSERLRQCRLFAGLTQKKLSAKTGVPRWKIEKLESGKTRGYLDDIRAIVWFTGCGGQEQEILQCWRDFKPPVPKRYVQASVICYEDGVPDAG